MKTSTLRTKKSRQQQPPRAAKPTQVPSQPPPAASAKTDQPAPAPKQELDAWLESRKQRKAEQTALIAADPRKAMSVAQDRLDYGIELFSALIEKGVLYYEQKTTDGTQDFSCDHAAQSLCSRLSSLNQKFAKYARAGHPDFVAAAWWTAKLFAELVHDLAFDKETARKLESYARRSLFLPSLRARPGTFTHDFQTVAETLHLSEDCLCHMADSAAHRLDSPVTRLIAEVVESIGWAQEHVRIGREFYTRSRELHADPKFMARLPKGEATFAHRLNAMTEDEYLVQIHHSRPETLHYDRLPPLTRATADEWWIKAVRQEVTKCFASLQGTRLHALLKGNKPHEKLDDLRRRGKDALRSLGRPTPQNPHPS